MAKNGWFMAFLPIFGTKNLKNDKSCEKPDFLFRKSISCSTIVQKEVWSSEQVFLPKNGFFPAILAKKRKNDDFWWFGLFLRSYKCEKMNISKKKNFIEGSPKSRFKIKPEMVGCWYGKKLIRFDWESLKTIFN